MRRNPVIKASNLRFCYPVYPGMVPGEVLRGIQLSLFPGDRMVILGRPDAGKTTLARILSGLIPHYVHGALEGEILFRGRDLKSLRGCDLIDQMGVLFQNPDEQIIMTRCDSELAFPLESLETPRDMIRERIEEGLQRMGLAGKEARSPASLSGGEKKKLLFAEVMGTSPEVWIMDETLEEVDRETRGLMADYFLAEGITLLIFASKWLPEFDSFINRAALLEGGVLQDLPVNGDLPALCAEGGFLLREEPRGEAGVPESPAAAPLPRRNLIRCEELSFTYSGGGFSLNIPLLELGEGETVALVGRNGSGKSSLARLLSGLEKPASGRILTAASGEGPPAWHRADSAFLNRFTGYLFQNPDYQIFLSTVQDELEYGLKIAGLKSEERQAKIREAAERFKLPPAEAPPSLLSYGSRKRLQAAVYWLLDKPFYILDEADSGLSAADFIEMVNQFRAKGAALLFITHNAQLAERGADRILTIRGGTL